MSADDAIDWVALEARYSQRPGAVDRLVQIAIDTTLEAPVELRRFAEAADLVALGHAAHALRGGAQAIQATRVGQLAGEVEAACRGGAPDAIAQALLLASAVDSMLEELVLRTRALTGQPL